MRSLNSSAAVASKGGGGGGGGGGGMGASAIMEKQISILGTALRQKSPSPAGGLSPAAAGLAANDRSLELWLAYIGACEAVQEREGVRQAWEAAVDANPDSADLWRRYLLWSVSGTQRRAASLVFPLLSFGFLTATAFNVIYCL